MSARGAPFRSPSLCGPPESSEPGLSPQARSRPNLKSEPVGAASGRRYPAWRPQPGMGGGEGPAGWAWGAPGRGCRARTPGSPCPRGASGRAWCCRPGKDWAKLWLVPVAHSPQPPLWAGPTSCLLRSWQKFKISPPGRSICLSGLGLVVGWSPSGAAAFLPLLCFLKQLPALSELGALLMSSCEPGWAYWAGGRTG